MLLAGVRERPGRQLADGACGAGSAPVAIRSRMARAAPLFEVGAMLVATARQASPRPMRATAVS